MNEQQKDFYQKLRLEIKNWIEGPDGMKNKWAEYTLLAPDLFHLLVKLSVDPEVPASKKVKLLGIIAYFISPLDLLPEALVGPAGYLDDIALAAIVLNDFLNEIDPRIVHRNWAGERDILLLIKTIVANANNIVGSGMYRKLKRIFRG